MARISRGMKGHTSPLARFLAGSLDKKKKRTNVPPRERYFKPWFLAPIMIMQQAMHLATISAILPSELIFNSAKKIQTSALIQVPSQTLKPMAQSSFLKVLEQCQVSTPPDFIPQLASLPLTLFDLLWIPLSPVVQRLFFYAYHYDTTHFMHTALPDLKHSLSLTLQHFYPLAGTLTWHPQSTKPIINCNQSNSGVTLIVAESNLNNFNDLVGNHARDVNDFYPLVPPLSSAKPQVENPVMALQVTLFPNTGICIGISYLHVIADGTATNHFMKSWASVCRSGLGDTSCLLPELLPSYDRSLIHDPNHLEATYLRELQKVDHFQQDPQTSNTPRSQVRYTFVMVYPDTQKIKRYILDRLDKMYNKDTMTRTPSHLSTFVATCAYVWVCMVKLKVQKSDQSFDRMKKEHLVFAMECRKRLTPPIPTTYFGNCVMPCFVEVTRNDLIGEDGIVIAAEAIGNAIQWMSNKVLNGADNLLNKVKDTFKLGALSIAGSPKLAVYDTDFGWGKPKKVEVVSIDDTEAMSISECQDGKGGLEIGLVLSKLEMDAFTSLFTDNFKVIS